MTEQAPPKRAAMERFLHLMRLCVRMASARSEVIVSLAVRAGAVLAGFAVTFMIGRNFGAAANGQFALVTQTAAFFAVVGLLGLDVSVVRHFAKSMAAGTKIGLAAFMQVTGIGMSLMVAISMGLWIGGDLIWSRLFGNTVPREMLLVLCVLLVGRGGSNLLSGLLRSQHRFTLGQIIASLIIPLATAVALIGGLAKSVESALWATAIGGLASFLFGAVAMRRHIGRGPEALAIPLPPVLASSLPLWGVGIALNIGDWYGLAVAAQVLGAADAGLYRVAIQFAATLQIVTMTIFSIYTAKISTAFHADDLKTVAMHARSALRVGIAAAAPVAAVVILAGDHLLGFIGPEFRAALPALVVLVLGQLAYTIVGPSGLVLAMSGNERTNLSITLVGTTVLLVLVPLAAQWGGLMGLALCASGVNLLRQVIAYCIVRKRLKIFIWSGKVGG